MNLQCKWIQTHCIVYWTTSMPLHLYIKKTMEILPHQTWIKFPIQLFCFFLKFLKCFTSTFTILFQTVPYRKSGGPLCASTTCQVFYIILRNAPRDKLQTKTDELTTLKKNLCQQKMIGIWAKRPLWPPFTHLKERRLLLDTLPWEICVICRLV